MSSKKIRITGIFFLLLFIGIACESAQDQITRREAAAKKSAAAQAEKPDGQAVFRQYCTVCHGPDGKLGLNGAKDLSQSTLTLSERVNQITNGKNLMTPFSGILSPDEISAAAEFTLTLKKQ